MGNDIDNHFTIISDNKEQLTNIFNKFFNKLSNDCEVKLKKDKVLITLLAFWTLHGCLTVFVQIWINNIKQTLCLRH